MEALRWLRERGATDLHHGAAVGADQHAAHVAALLGFRLTAHPATAGRELARNREIVAACDVLVATPATEREVLRSGTWATVRYARQAGKPVLLLPPNGGATVKACE
jgi:predicted Rossmann fold nucleotide-binding protein DprA/Smf involved in DNA uptake